MPGAASYPSDAARAYFAGASSTTFAPTGPSYHEIMAGRERAALVEECEKVKKEWALSAHERNLANLDFMARIRSGNF
eukprot:757157-Prymnesium_polylepis.1